MDKILNIVLLQKFHIPCLGSWHICYLETKTVTPRFGERWSNTWASTTTDTSSRFQHLIRIKDTTVPVRKSIWRRIVDLNAQVQCFVASAQQVCINVDSTEMDGWLLQLQPFWGQWWTSHHEPVRWCGMKRRYEGAVRWCGTKRRYEGAV